MLISNNILRIYGGEQVNKRRKGYVAFVCDTDNHTNCSESNWRTRRMTLDLAGLTAALRERRVTRGVACQNWNFTPAETYASGEGRLAMRGLA